MKIDTANHFRPMDEDDIMLLAKWESGERPYPWSLQTFREALLHGCPTKIFVLETKGELVAFAAVHRAGTEAYLSNIMAAPGERRKGHAEQLLQRVMIWAKSSGASELFLDVDPANTSALALYEKSDFEIVERRPHSYPRGEDAIIMRKKL